MGKSYKGWSSIPTKEYHQARIGSDNKQNIRLLAIIKNESIGELTDQAIKSYIELHSQEIKEYHQKQCEVH